MSTEIERRFLLSVDTEWLWGMPCVAIEQGYLEVPDPKRSLRIRILNGEKGTKGTMAVKCGVGIRRDEYEETIPLDLARVLMDTCHHRIRKTRYYLYRTPERSWEVDVLDEPLQGIVLAECELDSPNERVKFPSWFNSPTEVTDSVTNLHLARLATDLTNTEDQAVPALRQQLASQIKRIVIAGGPCSGKSTLITVFKDRYPDVHFVPEVASIIISQVGIEPPKSTVEENRFQQAVYRTQRIFEKTSAEFAIAQGKRAVVFDRGTVDSPVYLTGHVSHFEQLFGTTLERECTYYDSVLFLGMPSRAVYEYQAKNNPARSESYEQAKKRHECTRYVWQSHSKCRFVDDTNEAGEHISWEEKRAKAIQVFESLLTS